MEWSWPWRKDMAHQAVIQCAQTWYNLGGIRLQCRILRNFVQKMLDKWSILCLHGRYRENAVLSESIRNHRSFFRFLWFPENDSNLSPVGHEMCADVFGPSSSPGCSNYSLKRTSTDYVKEFCEDACNTLKKNFYFESLLISQWPVCT